MSCLDDQIFCNVLLPFLDSFNLVVLSLVNKDLFNRIFGGNLQKAFDALLPLSPSLSSSLSFWHLFTTTGKFLTYKRYFSDTLCDSGPGLGLIHPSRGRAYQMLFPKRCHDAVYESVALRQINDTELLLMRLREYVLCGVKDALLPVKAENVLKRVDVDFLRVIVMSEACFEKHITRMDPIIRSEVMRVNSLYFTSSLGRIFRSGDKTCVFYDCICVQSDWFSDLDFSNKTEVVLSLEHAKSAAQVCMDFILNKATSRAFTHGDDFVGSSSRRTSRDLFMEYVFIPHYRRTSYDRSDIITAMKSLDEMFSKYCDLDILTALRGGHQRYDEVKTLRKTCRCFEFPPVDPDCMRRLCTYCCCSTCRCVYKKRRKDTI